MLTRKSAEHEHAAALSVRGVTVTYANGHTALKDASFEVGGSTICALVGVNGSGKSTLFKAIMGFVEPVAGEVRICGLAVREALKRASSPTCRRARRSTGTSLSWSRTWCSWAATGTWASCASPAARTSAWWTWRWSGSASPTTASARSAS